MENNNITIALVGAGEPGAPLLQQLLKADFVRIVGVYDEDNEASGMKIAREHGIPTTTDYIELVSDSKHLDLIIEVTGVREVRESLRDYMHEMGNPKTIIVPEIIAILLMSLSQGELVKIIHEDIHY